MKMIKRYCQLWLGLLLTPAVASAQNHPYGAAGLAENVLQPVSVVSSFLATACFVIGGGFLLASLVKYIEHRRSPLMVPISTVVFLLLAGVVLIILPFVSRWAGVGV